MPYHLRFQPPAGAPIDVAFNNGQPEGCCLRAARVCIAVALPMLRPMLRSCPACMTRPTEQHCHCAGASRGRLSAPPVLSSPTVGGFETSSSIVNLAKPVVIKPGEVWTMSVRASFTANPGEARFAQVFVLFERPPNGDA